MNEDKETLEGKAAEVIKDRLKLALDTGGKAVFGVPGGRSVKGIFDKLKNSDLEWGNIHIFMVDERFVPLTHNDSNYKLLRESLGVGNIHAFDYKKPVSTYDSKFNRAGGRFDVVLLGAGEDGHVASLFPNHPSIKNSSKGYIKVITSSKPPPTRISASRFLLEQSKTAILLFFGESKQRAYKNFQDKSLTVEQCPAKLVKKIKDSYVYYALR